MVVHYKVTKGPILPRIESSLSQKISSVLAAKVLENGYLMRDKNCQEANSII